jgi:hypothetical protein
MGLGIVGASTKKRKVIATVYQPPGSPSGLSGASPAFTAALIMIASLTQNHSVTGGT